MIALPKPIKRSFSGYDIFADCIILRHLSRLWYLRDTCLKSAN
jgi:hypothetical protein